MRGLWKVAGAVALAWGSASGCGDASPRDGRADGRVDEKLLDAGQRQEIERLQQLGYVAGDQPAGNEALVTVHDPGRVFPGYNLYTSEHAPRAFLLDMQGNVLHMWELPIGETLPMIKLRRVKLFENGDLLVLIEARGLVRIDRNSDVIWSVERPFHHDFEVQDDGSIYVLSRAPGVYPAYDPERPIRNESVTILSPEREVVKDVSMLTALQNSTCCRHYLGSGEAGDIFHSNTVEVLDGRLAGRHPAFKRGNVLTSWRRMDAIGVIDMEAEKVVWSFDGPFRRQHQPTVLDSGRLLIFDNRDVSRRPRASRVIEIDPFTGVIHWEFHARPDFPFFSNTGGASEQLDNGNVLISETRGGRILEVAPNGDIVWAYVNPARVGENGEKMSRIFEGQRIPADFPLDWLSGETLPTQVLWEVPAPAVSRAQAMRDQSM